MTSASDRLHYMDNLRALAMLLGIFFHAALAYTPSLSNLWLGAGPESSVIFEQVAWFSHTFRMPLFFLIAGFFALLLLNRRGVKGFILHRVKRIGLPFIVFTPLMLITVFISVGWATTNVQNPSPMIGFMKYMMSNPEAAQEMETPQTTMHMWFLYYLMQFCLVAALIHKAGLLTDKVCRVLTNPLVVVLIYPLVMAAALVTVHAPHPAPEQYVPQLWAYGFYGVFFLLGMAIYKNQDVLTRLEPFALPLFISSLGLYWLLFPLLPETIGIEDLAKMLEGPEFSIEHLTVAILEAYIGVHMTIVCLVFGAKVLSGSSKALRYIADGSYWVYIVHLPVLFIIQFHLLDVEWGLWVEFLISSFGTLAVGFATYALLVRWTPIGILLNGRRVPLSSKKKSIQPAKSLETNL